MASNNTGEILAEVAAVAVMAACKQSGSNIGFEAGKNGDPPKAFFFSEEYREAYESGYAKGQQAAAINLMNKAARKLEE
ncbi:hypothetical protein M1432_02880 [Patescibacteria group bacterium]|nr:hypothetical protein [Patescibacteria group bacterium]